jgi:hypothetical protein
MMPGPERDVRELNHPDLKVPPGMLDAFDAANDLAEHYPNMRVRIIDADTLLDPPAPFGMEPPMPRHVVEVFIDALGVLLVATGRDSDRPVCRAELPLPHPGPGLVLRSFREALAYHADRAMEVLAKHDTGRPEARWP